MGLPKPTDRPEPTVRPHFFIFWFFVGNLFFHFNCLYFHVYFFPKSWLVALWAQYYRKDVRKLTLTLFLKVFLMGPQGPQGLIKISPGAPGIKIKLGRDFFWKFNFKHLGREIFWKFNFSKIGARNFLKIQFCMIF